MIEQNLCRLRAMKLSGMAEAYEHQEQNPKIQSMSFDDRMSLIIDREDGRRQDRRFKGKLKKARFRYPEACLEEFDFSVERGVQKSRILDLANCKWIEKKQNLFLIGPAGSGKTYLACALARQACILGHTAKYIRLPRLLNETMIAKADGSYMQLMAQLNKTDVVIFDDWGIGKLTEEQRRDLLEIIEDRYELRSIIITSQLPVANWYDLIGEPQIADAILDRLVHSAHKLELKTKQSMREKMTTLKK